MDIKNIRTEEQHFDDSIPCPLYTNGEPEVDSAGNAVVVQVVSEHSKASRRVTQTQKQRMSALIRRYGAWEKIPQTDLDTMADERTAACITGWTGFEDGGAPFPYSKENAVVVVAGLREYKPDHMKQIESAIAGHASFFVKPSVI